MTYRPPARTRTRRIPRLLLAGPLIVVAAIAAAVGLPSLGSSSSTAAPPLDLRRPDQRAADGAPDPPPAAPEGSLRERPGPARALGVDGALPAGTTVFDGYPGVANLDPALLGALRQAATVAAGAGIGFQVNSGWRSPEYQARLRREAVAEYGSEAEAARWVATPETSAHVAGEAVDIGPAEAARWLAEHGAGYGLCQIYRNEPWHFELRPEAVERGCPALYADPTEDPRHR